MASVLKYFIDSSQLQKDIQDLYDEVKSRERINFINARKIQAWFRGIITRCHFRYLHKVAVVIQRHWRGYAARKLFVQKKLELLNKLQNKSATKIQATWRGYKSRKNVHDYYKLKDWLKHLKQKEEELKLQNETEKIKKIDEIVKPWVIFILRKLHHLQRTRCRPGVITKIDEIHSTTIEQMINCLGHRIFFIKNNECVNLTTK